MTAEEICKKYNLSESTLKTKFKRTQDNVLKNYGIRIIKEGRGASALYREEVEDDGRALTLYEEKADNIMLREDSLSLATIEFVTFVAIITTPMLVFRGSYTDFLKYIEMPISAKNVDALKLALVSLQNREYISYTIDKTDDNYFIAGLYKRTEDEMSVGIEMIKRCKYIAGKNRKQSWIPLLKTWVAMQIVVSEQPFVTERLQDITGLSPYQIRESKKLLEADEVFVTCKAYKSYQKCIGQTVELNGFIKENRGFINEQSV